MTVPVKVLETAISYQFAVKQVILTIDKTIKVSPIKFGKYDLRSTNKYMLKKVVHLKSEIVNTKNITCIKAT